MSHWSKVDDRVTSTVRGGQQTVSECAKMNLCSLKKERKKRFGKLLQRFLLAKRMWRAVRNGSGVSKKLPCDPKYFWQVRKSYFCRRCVAPQESSRQEHPVGVPTLFISNHKQYPLWLTLSGLSLASHSYMTGWFKMTWLISRILITRILAPSATLA